MGRECITSSSKANRKTPLLTFYKNLHIQLDLQLISTMAGWAIQITKSEDYSLK